uniref:N-acetyltransferase domain-containing protein n=1 Tax=Steinernema glaseri TaxID=37863 RepID=A0A1I7ZRG8_9BILA
MEDRRWFLAPFVDFSHFEDACIAILNKEWPRSRTQRETSFRRSSNRKPPMALLLLSEDGSELGGHARLCGLPQDVDGCWVESVILREDLRGKGVGRLLMELLERKAKEFGFKKMYLSTEDKQKFYERCGFACCPPVLHAGASGSLLAGRNLSLLANAPSSQSAPTSPRPTPATVTNGAPPPPPPPPSTPKQQKAPPSKKFNASTPKQYMVKDL